jgi:hypothetical protein
MSDANQRRRSSINADIVAQAGIISMPEGKAPAAAELSKATMMTQAAINSLPEGGLYASGAGKVVDAGMVAAKTEMAIKAKGGASVDPEKAPKDRAINEALTLKAIGAGKVELKKTEGADTGMSAEKLAALQADAAAEKAAKEAARTFGGGDAKEGMGNILKDIQGQGGIIAVPVGKAPADNISVVQAKAMMAIAAGNTKELKHVETKADAGLAQANLLQQIAGQEAKAVSKPIADRATSEALTMRALSASASRTALKETPKPAEGLTAEQQAALLAAAKEEKA